MNDSYKADSYKAYIAVVGRILLALMFILSGFGKFTNIHGTAAYMVSAGMPAPTLLVLAVAALELFGGIALVVGFRVRPVGLALALFTLAASVQAPISRAKRRISSSGRGPYGSRAWSPR